MTAPTTALSLKQRRRLFRLFRDEIIAWLCCLRTAAAGQQSVCPSSQSQFPGTGADIPSGTPEFLIPIDPLPHNFPFAAAPIRRRFPIADKRRPDRAVTFDVELEFRERETTSMPMVWVMRCDWQVPAGAACGSFGEHAAEGSTVHRPSLLGYFEIPLSVIEDPNRTFDIDTDLVLEGISCSVANAESVYLLQRQAKHPDMFDCRAGAEAETDLRMGRHGGFFMCTGSGEETL
ncbi:Heterotrimeric G-protein alpha subunit 4 [Mycena kentingensis (nom. inval.)]|nr:Heterotrimeric G-protein alpha subunit 4 [Mycena kentingensis (nom. inval.)]